MSNPKFKVGEEVVLVAVGRELSNLNGDYVVEAVVRNGTVYTCQLTGSNHVLYTDVEWCYRLQGLTPEYPCQDGSVREGLWKETRLRKKHQKGDMSFENLMETLKFPEKVK